MLFKTLVFLIFLSLVVTLNFSINNSKRKHLILFSGYIFYAYWDWRFCGLLLGSTIIDYFVHKKLSSLPALKFYDNSGFSGWLTGHMEMLLRR